MEKEYLFLDNDTTETLLLNFPTDVIDVLYDRTFYKTTFDKFVYDIGGEFDFAMFNKQCNLLENHFCKFRKRRVNN